MRGRASMACRADEVVRPAERGERQHWCALFKAGEYTDAVLSSNKHPCCARRRERGRTWMRADREVEDEMGEVHARQGAAEGGRAGMSELPGGAGCR